MRYRYAAFPKGTRLHEVVRGEFPYKIAQQYGITIKIMQIEWHPPKLHIAGWPGIAGKFIFPVIFSLAFCFSSKAQEGVLTLGIHFRAMFPARFLNIDPVVSDKEFLEVTTESPRGTGFGMPVRYGFTQLWSMETGIYFNRRNYNQTVIDDETGFKGEISVPISSYEIPLMALANIQLEDKVFMNVGAGVSGDMFTGDTQRDYENPEGGFNSIFLRRNWFQMSVLGTLGVEYRTDDSGFIYLGATFHRPFNYLIANRVKYYRDPNAQGSLLDADSQLDGTYFSLDLRYFFPVKEEDKTNREEMNIVKPDF